MTVHLRSSTPAPVALASVQGTLALDYGSDVRPTRGPDLRLLPGHRAELEAKELKNILDDIPDLEIHGPDSIGWAEETEPGKTIYVMDHVGRRSMRAVTPPMRAT